MVKKDYFVVGMMSGTSLDGMDFVLCRFCRQKGKWEYEIIKAETYDYPPEWKRKLTCAADLSVSDFLVMHNQYGSYIGEMIIRFLTSGGFKADLVASHGHTIFHQPERQFTFQLGSGAAISAACGITTVSDFRTMDVALGGQGAPLVPVGDELLFGEFPYCLNLGGFANISNLRNQSRIAFDICPVNIVANHLAQIAGCEFDKDGLLGSSGRIIPALVNELNNLGFYEKRGPKSLGREWVESVFLPVITRYEFPPEDMLRSVYEHIAFQISTTLNNSDPGRILVTGGGAFNRFLIQLIQEKTKSKLVVPEETVVKFKEALIFAFLGLLRFINEINCLASVTGARSDSSSGIINLAPGKVMDFKGL